MGLGRLFSKGITGGALGLAQGHLLDAYKKKKMTGRSFKECLNESVKETFTEDMPGTSHLYRMGHSDGRKKGTAEQAERDARKFQAMDRQHEQERERWRQIDREKDELIDDLGKQL